MKKLTACILAFLLLAFAGVCASAGTEILQSGNFRYILLEDGGAAIITAETEGELVIPAELDGHPVTSLGLDAHPDTYLIYKAAGLLDANRTVVRGVVSGQRKLHRHYPAGQPEGDRFLRLYRLRKPENRRSPGQRGFHRQLRFPALRPGIRFRPGRRHPPEARRWNPFPSRKASPS